LNTGDITVQNILPPRNRKINININPNRPIDRKRYMALSGRNDASIFEPSSGGMGRKLNIARKIFIYIVF
jgi:hypothetical protein